MNNELLEILAGNIRYKETYYSFLEFHKEKYSETPEEFAEFERNYGLIKQR